MPRPTQQQYARRVQRLLALINEIKTNPRQTPAALSAALGISRAMFYKDRELLATLGFTFRYVRSQHQFVITQEPFLPVLNLNSSEVPALIMAVRQLSSTGDYTLTYDAIAALGKVISNTPAELRAFFQASLDDVVLQQGFGCDATIVHDLWRACQEHRRLRIVHDRGDGPQEWVIDPYHILFKRRARISTPAWWPSAASRCFAPTASRGYFLWACGCQPRWSPTTSASGTATVLASLWAQVQHVRIKFRPEVRQYITETRRHSSQQIEALPDGSFIFQVEVSEPREVGWWALQWGASAEVLEPQSLRREMATTARKLVEVYGTYEEEQA